MPGRDTSGGMTGQGLQRGLLKTHQMRHHHPAQDQVVTITKIGLERSKQTRYFCGQPRHFGHGWPCCWVVKTGFTHLSSYLQAGWPATHPVFVPLAPIRPKRQHNHHANLIYLSSLSNYGLSDRCDQGRRAVMDKIKIIHDMTSQTLTVWIDDPTKESVC